MAWARVGSGQMQNISGSSLSYSPVNGNLVIAVLAVSGSAPTITSLKDNHAVALTEIASVTYTLAGAFGQMAAFAYLATGTPTSFVTAFTGAGNVGNLTLVEFSGVTATLDGTAATHEYNGSGSTGQPTYSSTAANELLVSFMGDDGNGATYTGPSGWTTDTNSYLAGTADTNTGVAWKNSTGGSETGAAYTASSTADGGIILVAFQLPGGAATPIPNVVMAPMRG